MEVLPDFSNSKIEIRNRIEGALREKKRRPSIYQYSLFLCLFFFTTICTALYVKTILLGQRNILGGNMDYYSLEQLLRSEQLESETIIELPSSISFVSATESSLMSNINFVKGSYE